MLPSQRRPARRCPPGVGAFSTFAGANGAGAFALATTGAGTAFAAAFPLVGALPFAVAVDALAASAALFARVLAAFAAEALAASIFARCAATRSLSIRSDSLRAYSAAWSPSASRSVASRASSMALAELCSL